MRVLLIYSGGLFYGEQPLGILYLSAALKKAGHETSVWIPASMDYYLKRLVFSKSGLRKEIDRFSPQLVGFSVDSANFGFTLQMVKMVKTYAKVPIIFGGPHPTVDPESTIAHPLVDMICIGEGEEALVELVSKMEKDGDTASVANIWGESNGRTFRNPVRQLIPELDSLPYPDRDALAPAVYREQGLNVITSRGCPYHCSFCIEDHLHQLYSGKGRPVRFRDISKVIEELKIAVKSCKPKLIVFSDEVFTGYRNRCIEFCHAYEKEVGLPFLCQTRANTVDGDTLQALKKAGCMGVHIGIEAGNDYVRNEVLEKSLSRKAIINAFALAKEVGLATASFNMIGAPFETEEMIWETIKLNRQVRPDEPQVSILVPYKGTKVRSLLEKRDWIAAEGEIRGYGLTVLQRLPTISRYRLLSYNAFFGAYVRSAEKNYFWLNGLRIAYEFLLRLLPVNSLLQRLSQFVMGRVLRATDTKNKPQ